MSNNARIACAIGTAFILIIVLVELKSTGTGGSGSGSGSSSSDDERELQLIRNEIDELKALIRKNNRARAGAGGRGSGGAMKPAGSAGCPACRQCLAPNCPECDSSAGGAGGAAASGAAVVSGPSGDAVMRCAKFPIDLPPEIKRLTLQVGAHMSPLEPEGTDHATISFEPQIPMVVSANNRKLKNLFMIPAAASLFDAMALFDLAGSHDASASLNAFNPKIASWSGHKVLVPVIRLQSLLECIPRDRFPFIDFFLCDAQGSDLDVMKSLGPEIKRFRRIEMEVQVNKFAYYQSDNSKTNAIKYMNSMGFEVVSANCNGVDAATHARDPTICEEENVVFQPKR